MFKGKIISEKLVHSNLACILIWKNVKSSTLVREKETHNTLGLRLHTCLETSELQCLTHNTEHLLPLSLLRTALQTLLT